MHRCAEQIKKTLLLLKITLMQGVAVCESERYMLQLFICLCSAWWQRVTSVSWICLWGSDSCGQQHRLRWWLVITQNSSATLCKFPWACTRRRALAWMPLNVCPRVCALAKNVCLYVYIPTFMCIQSGIWRVSLHPPMVGLPQPDGWFSASVSEVTAGWPGLSWPRIWILSSDSSWWVTRPPSPPNPPMCLLHGNSRFTGEIGDVSQHALMKCKWYEPHPGETTPELLSALKEVATLLMID